MEAGTTRVWRPSWPCPVGTVLGPLRHGRGDPAYVVDEADRHWLAMRTPLGPATLLLEPRADLGEVHAEAWGPGAVWALDGVPALLGAEDDPSGFEPLHPVIAETWRRYPHLRIGRTGRVFEALVPAVIEQKVTGQEAHLGYRALVRRFGEPAPGPGAGRRLAVLPDAATVRAVPSWEWLRMHIDPARSRALVRAAQVADSLERCAGLDPVEADRRLRSIPGIGVWTSAEVRLPALGDADAVSFGDYHVAKDVGWALFGHDIDDDELATVLEPYRPHRARVVQLVFRSGVRRPRRGPRMAPRTHLPVRGDGGR
ncbi:MAG: DNA-3-methyladenine glycosylase 2 family protein [Nocardioidaceae bacterium]